MRIRVMGPRRDMWSRGRLQHARTDTTPLTLTPVPLTATTDLAGFRVECSSASGHGAGVDAAITVAGDTMEAGAATTVAMALPVVDTTEAGRPTPGAEAIAAEWVMAMPAEHVPTAAVDAPTAEVLEASEADMPTVVADAAPVDAEMPTAAAHAALVVADMPSAAVGTAVADMVVGAGRFRHQLEILAADSTCCRPQRFRNERAADLPRRWPPNVRLRLRVPPITEGNRSDDG
jgi:hypothetical protein